MPELCDLALWRNAGKLNLANRNLKQDGGWRVGAYGKR